MGERRFVHELSRSCITAVEDGELRRLAAHKDRVVALLRAGGMRSGGYRSSYAARLWAMSQAEGLAAETGEPARPALALVE